MKHAFNNELNQLRRILKEMWRIHHPWQILNQVIMFVLIKFSRSRRVIETEP